MCLTGERPRAGGSHVPSLTCHVQCWLPFLYSVALVPLSLPLCDLLMRLLETSRTDALAFCYLFFVILHLISRSR